MPQQSTLAVDAKHSWVKITDKIQAYNGGTSVRTNSLLGDIPLEISTYANAFVSRREIVNSKDGVKFENLSQWYSRGAVYNSDGILLPDFRDLPNPSKFDNPLKAEHDRVAAATRVEGRCIYLGTLHGHFGHFLIESLARAWGLLRQDTQVRALFHFANGTRNELFHDPERLGFPKFVKTMLGAIGIGADRLVLANKDMVVDELLIPTAQFEMDAVGSTGLGIVYDHIREELYRRKPAITGLPNKIYLTRTGLVDDDPKKGRKSVANERAVEELFVARGFEVVSPERLPFEEQVALVSNATHIAGTTGSALHMIVFNNNPEAQVIAVDWRNTRTQYILEAGRGLNAAHIYCFDGWTQDKRPLVNLDTIDHALVDLTGSPASAPQPKPVLQYVPKEVVPLTLEPSSQLLARVPRPVVETPAARRLKRIAAHVGATSYLEIGVAKGSTFNSVDLRHKVAVDPVFRFNVEEFQQDGVEFVAKTSDDFFLHLEEETAFDLIFLDGLHTFEQTLRDFCNSMSCAHRRTVWLIDDVLPVDVFSSLSSFADAVEFRKAAGVTAHANGWHGDVYKLPLMIHDFFPLLNYVTISNRGNPQTIVWRAPRVGFKPVFENAEAIARLGYFDLLKRENLLNLMTEEEAFDYFFASMPGGAQRGGANP